ncbi:hypothetical protein GCM10027034_22770 [Ramlibacter solisilvae]|uniref:Uncharacterized protein n=2 Tax=Ramlibacter tataouinensis TaxID=94132 RepID=A0A127JPS6_9BURK|nr:hypothetical protein UC35_02810 [Ramlibacter tataouinensis]
MTPEEAARHAALLEADERDQAQKVAAKKAAAEKAEADRLAFEQAANARQAAEEKAKADQLAAERRKKQHEDSTVVSDVDRVLQRARADYPVLSTPEGQPLLARIVDKQKALVATGMYPSMAMVQAVADHEFLLRPAAPQPAAPEAEQATAGQTQAFGGCRWVTPTQWACNK